MALRFSSWKSICWMLSSGILIFFRFILFLAGYHFSLAEIGFDSQFHGFADGIGCEEQGAGYKDQAGQDAYHEADAGDGAGGLGGRVGYIAEDVQQPGREGAADAETDLQAEIMAER